MRRPRSRGRCARIARVPGVDVVIVGRGGGSIEDLWAFNEEIVARAIARVPVPVISAVGHETDVTIADFVADVRAPTPSAAAELVVSAKDEFCGRIDRLRDRLRAAARARVQALSRRVHVAGARPAFAGFPGRVAMRGRHAAELSHALARIMRAGLAARERRRQQIERQLTTFDLGRRLAGIRTRLVGAGGRLTGAVRRRQHRAVAQLGSVAGRLDTLSPLAVLGRGYAVAWNADRTRVLRDASSAAPGDTVRVTLARGELECEVRVDAPSPHAHEDAQAVFSFVSFVSFVFTQCCDMPDTSIKDFEAAIAELEAIVKKLEEGDLALEQSLALYERGVQLSRFCHARLEEAERRIEILNERGELKAAPDSLMTDEPGALTVARSVPRGVPRTGPDRGRRCAERWLPRPPDSPADHRRGDALQRLRRRQAPAAGADARRRRCRGAPCGPARGGRAAAPVWRESGSLALAAACAIELIHTYSLIHDDLPAMDNDTLRRGRPTLHVVYGEGIAILAGDGLHAAAFALLAREPAAHDPAIVARKLRVLAVVGDAAGPDGMVGGQAIDLQAAGQAPGHAVTLDADGLRAMHARKTGALIRASAVSGAIMAGAADDLVEAIDRYAAEIGLAFQIVDDILDVEGESGVARQDRRQGRRRRQADLSGALRRRPVPRPGGRVPRARASQPRRGRPDRRLARADRGLGCVPPELATARDTTQRTQRKQRTQRHRGTAATSRCLCVARG